MEWKHFLYVAAGGGLGSVLRTWLGQVLRGGFPWSTFAVNLGGSFLIGVLFHCLGNEEDDANLRFFLIAGFCGGFTTFSTFSLDVLKLFRDGHPGLAAANVILSVICCLAAVFAGWRLSAAG